MFADYYSESGGMSSKGVSPVVDLVKEGNDVSAGTAKGESPVVDLVMDDNKISAGKLDPENRGGFLQTTSWVSEVLTWILRQFFQTYYAAC